MILWYVVVSHSKIIRGGGRGFSKRLYIAVFAYAYAEYSQVGTIRFQLGYEFGVQGCNIGA